MKERENHMSPEYTKQTTCRSCGSKHLEPILSLGKQRVVSFGDEVPPQVPLNLVLCEDCKLLQLEHNTRADLMFGDNYGYRSGVNETMRNELTSLARSAEKMVHFYPGDRVIDIGCNDGTLLSSYEQPFLKFGFDPSVNVAKYAVEAGHEVNFGFFKAENYPYQKAKIITAIAMFYDLEKPDEFIQDIKKCLSYDGVFVIQQNYLKGMLEQLAFDNICHEHLEYYTLLSLEPILKRNGLEVFDVATNDINGGSFRTYIRHQGACVYSTGGFDRIQEMRRSELKAKLDEKETYQEFARKVEASGQYLSHLVRRLNSEGKKVYVYGASTRGGTLLQFAGLDSKDIIAAAERNPDKWGKVMQTTGIPIVSEDEAREKADYFLVLPWFFKNEFVKREQAFLERGGHLIFPLPTLQVI